MQCPNCKRTVRSKTQCVHCGELFSQEDKVKGSEELIETGSVNNEPVVPHTPRRGAMGLLGGVIRVFVAVFIVFGAFLYGPTLVKTLIGSNNDSPTEQVEPAQENEQAEGSDSTQLESQEEAQRLTVEGIQVNTDNYPQVHAEMTVAGDLEKLAPGILQFSVKDGEEVTEIAHYSLIQKEDELLLLFNNPAFANQQYGAGDQELIVTSEELGIDQTATFHRPELAIDQEAQENIRTILSEELTSAENKSVFVNKIDASEAPYIENNVSMEADSLISWFLIQKTYQEVAAGNLDLEGNVEGTGEEPLTLAQTLEQIVIDLNNADLMNALLETLGGPDAFNLWLNESGYFGTQLESRFSRTESGEVTGAQTTILDVSALLTHLAKGELIDEEFDGRFEELMRSSPLTVKFPDDELAGIHTRSELISADESTTSHHYSGIIRTEAGTYVVVILNQGGDAETVNGEVRATLKRLLLTIAEGVSEDSPEEVPSEEYVPYEEPAPGYYYEQPAYEQPAYEQSVYEQPWQGYTDEYGQPIHY